MWLRMIEFQSTSPMWGMTDALRIVDNKTNISIHIPHVGDDVARRALMMIGLISIHIPHVGDDSIIAFTRRFPRYFNPHPPCGG